MLETIRLGLVGREGTLFDALDASFREGDIWAVTGRASSGKTRLLGALHGERRPDAGDVLAGGASLFRGSGGPPAGFRRLSALVPDPVEAGPDTVGELFRLAALAMGDVPESERKDREDSLLSMVGLSGCAGAGFRSLSASEKFRAGLAVELFREPRILLLDSPFARIGKEWTEMLCGLLRALAREGRIVVLAERELPPVFPMKPVREEIRCGPIALVQLAAGAPGEGTA
jgi:putative ABC transport system ATP-binding protein